jgi:hypothetical protein
MTLIEGNPRNLICLQNGSMPLIHTSTLSYMAFHIRLFGPHFSVSVTFFLSGSISPNFVFKAKRHKVSVEKFAIPFYQQFDSQFKNEMLTLNLHNSFQNLFAVCQNAVRHKKLLILFVTTNVYEIDPL